MNKNITAILVSLALSLSFTACSSNNVKKTDPIKKNSMTEKINTDCSKEEHKNKSGCNM